MCRRPAGCASQSVIGTKRHSSDEVKDDDMDRIYDVWEK